MVSSGPRGRAKARVGLPDVASRSWICHPGERRPPVAWTLRLLGRRNGVVSRPTAPPCRARTGSSCADAGPRAGRFGWMALNVTRPEHRPNNWTALDCGQRAHTDLLCEPDTTERCRASPQMLAAALDGFWSFTSRMAVATKAPATGAHCRGGACLRRPGDRAQRTGGKTRCLWRSPDSQHGPVHRSGPHRRGLLRCRGRLRGPLRTLSVDWCFAMGNASRTQPCKRWPPPVHRWNPSWQDGSLAAVVGGVRDGRNPRRRRLAVPAACCARSGWPATTCN